LRVGVNAAYTLNNKGGIQNSIMKGLSALHHLATRSVIKQFATKFDLVYFGSVDSRSDEHQLVRGVTAASSHIDNNYTVGTYQGHDLILVERHNTVSHPGLPTVKHHWLILQLDVRRTDLPHMFLDSHNGDTFHANLNISNPRLRDITSLLPNLGHTRVIAPVERLDDIHAIITNDFIAAMHNFGQFDFEIRDDQVFVYAHHPMVTMPLLTDMLRVGAWLADYLSVATH